MKSLVIVESPAKAKTIEKYLGRGYSVKASMGHVVDLPKSQFGVDVDDNFRPKYINIRGKGPLIKELKSAAKKADRIFLATDPDREGEAISWHLANTLASEDKPISRIEFHEITKKAVQDSLKHPRSIDINMVNAQQARRVLDRVVGYQLSPLLWKRVRPGLSAGRVQSVAVRLICEREGEIEAFVPLEYWSINVDLLNSKNELFTAKLDSQSGRKLDKKINDKAAAAVLEKMLKQAEYQVVSVKRKEKKRNPSPPFTTSTMQQEAARKLGFSPRKTMSVAQQLYEGIDMGSYGSDGLITYMRTDSVRIAEEAQATAREVIANRFGDSYLPSQIPVYKTKSSNAQDAHEAIRPTTIANRPEQLKEYLTVEQYKLYRLIWERFISSQMASSISDTVTVDIKAADCLLRASGSQIKFDGFLKVYQEGSDDREDEQEKKLPEIFEGEKPQLSKVLPQQHFTQPPPRYTEASLIKTLEEKGIGRPSTYAPIIGTILARNYVTIEEKKLHPTELGKVVVDLLQREISQVIDYDFTASMEEKLDEVAAGKLNWVSILTDFYGDFNSELQTALSKEGRVELAEEVTDIPCEKCGRMMIVKYGRFGKFLACPGYPECKSTKTIRKEINVLCPKCMQGKLVERKSQKARGRKFFGCSRYPECDYASWEAPYKDPCPECGAMMLKKGSKLEPVMICQNEKCKHTFTPEENAE